MSMTCIIVITIEAIISNVTIAKVTGIIIKFAGSNIIFANTSTNTSDIIIN